MSDSFMYELDDIVWDEFGKGDDHIVPHPSEESADEHAFKGDRFKKPRHEVTNNQEMNIQTVNKKRNSMLQKDQWSHIPDNIFSDSCDTEAIQESGSLVSDNDRMLGNYVKGSNTNLMNGELCADDVILADKGTNSCSFSLSQISKANNDTGLFNNDCVEKESNDLVYYGWPDIGNFEDVDGMFRNCDSSFGLGGGGNQDDLGWFSSSEAIEGSDDPMKPDFKFPCPNVNTLNSVSEGSAVDHLSLVNGSDQVSECKDEFITNEKISYYKKHQNQGEGEIEDLCLENGSSNSSGLGLRTQKLKPHSSDYIQTNIPYVHSDYSILSDQTTTNPAISGFTSENNCPTSLSPKVSHDPKHCGNKFQNRSDVEDLCSLNVKENSSMNSRPEEISLEATSFCQLQQVTEQLDLKTKLCIRDSLFRLARSAEQRHNYANLNGSNDSSAVFIAAGSTKCTGFMDIETDTNPIDRSIAHLLFHRPSDSSAMPPHTPLKSHLQTTIHGSTMMGHEESAIETDGKAADQ